MRLKNKKTGEIKDVNIKTIERPNIPQGYPEYKLDNDFDLLFGGEDGE